MPGAQVPQFAQESVVPRNFKVGRTGGANDDVYRDIELLRSTLLDTLSSFAPLKYLLLVSPSPRGVEATIARLRRRVRLRLTS